MILLSLAGDLDPQQTRKLDQESGQLVRAPSRARAWPGVPARLPGAGALRATSRMALCQFRAKPLLIPACDFPAYGSFGCK